MIRNVLLEIARIISETYQVEETSGYGSFVNESENDREQLNNSGVLGN